MYRSLTLPPFMAVVTYVIKALSLKDAQRPSVEAVASLNVIAKGFEP